MGIEGVFYPQLIETTSLIENIKPLLLCNGRGFNTIGFRNGSTGLHIGAIGDNCARTGHCSHFQFFHFRHVAKEQAEKTAAAIAKEVAETQANLYIQAEWPKIVQEYSPMFGVDEETANDIARQQEGKPKSSGGDG